MNNGVQKKVVLCVYICMCMERPTMMKMNGRKRTSTLFCRFLKNNIYKQKIIIIVKNNSCITIMFRLRVRYQTIFSNFNAYDWMTWSIHYRTYTSDAICSSFTCDKCDYCCSSLFWLGDCNIHVPFFLPKKICFVCSFFLRIYRFTVRPYILSMNIGRTKHSWSHLNLH